ncbi:vam6/Vps39-like protein [Sitophilus oryzae]|uniref:Vam6/Vps39-like protein n=1 Tax=Sitophilus oryzae TaxID=7048 RepID=A0A6J2YI01_SITOR|nr:vam6/Vps39-like protein [Sitophilus oryzae]
MHEAYQNHSLIKLNHQIESIAAHDDTLLVGTRQGHLFMYKLENNSKCELTLMRYNKSFSKKPIQQLCIIPDQNLLVSLTDNLIQLHDINAINFTTLHQIPESKGATYFTVNPQKIVSTTGDTHVLISLAVAVKRKIQLYYLKKNEFHSFGKDILLNDIPKSMAWCQDVICVGYRDEYALLKVKENGKQTDLFPTSSTKSADPCILQISDSHFALCRENQTVLVNTEGETEKNKTLKWSAIPTYLAHDEPYTLGVLTDCIEVCTLEPSITIQTLPDMPKVRFLVQASSGVLFAASLSQVWCVKAIDVAKQREILVNSKEFQLALKLTQISNESEEEKQAKIHNIQTLLAYDLFAKKQFHESMNEFLKLETDAFDVIRLFPDLLPQGQQDEYPDSSKDLTDKELEDSRLALIEYLTEMRHRLQDTKGLSNARGNLSEKSSKSTDHLLQIIDTTLLKCYLQTNDTLVAPLIRLNHCHFAETEKILKKKGRHKELIILYQTKGQHRRALELLQSENDIDKTVTYLHHLGSENMGLILEFSEWVLNAAPEEGLKIFTEDIPEVENLPRPRILDTLLKSHKELAIPYLEYVIQKDDNPFFHNALVHQYREKILKDGVEQSEPIRVKLLEFLQQSTQYTAENVLRDFPVDCLIEERAIIVGRLGKHDQAVALYVRALGDLEKAKDYCKRVYDSGISGSQQVYVYLINIILKPDSFPLSLPGITLSPKTAQPDLELALQLLEENASKINPIDILTILPDDIPVSRLHKFLLVALQKVVQEERRVQLLKGLLYAEHLQCQELKLNLQNQRILVTELNVCPVCKKRFGNQSTLVRYPNGDVVHYSCHEKN